MGTPAYECLRRNFPDAHITALVRPYARDIIECSPWFDNIVDCDDKSLTGLRHIRTALANPTPQAGILFTNTTHSYLTFRLAGVKRVYGYRRNLHRFMLQDGPLPLRENGEGGKRGKIRAQPMQDYYLNLCRHLGLEMPANPKPVLYIDDEQQQVGEAKLREYEIGEDDVVIGLNPGASFGSSKCWPTEYYARLAELLQETYNCKLLLLVGPGEEGIANQIVQQSKASIINTAPQPATLAELKTLIRCCNLLITNDTGPRHYAVAFDVPHIVIMGSTDPILSAGNLEFATVLRRDLPCSPCHKRICPLGHHNCMREITPASVLQATEKYLVEGASL